MSKRYYTVAGEMIGERGPNGRLDYLPDALGSVIATVDEHAVVQSEARYKPYGSVLASSGEPITYGWVGTQGYRRTGLTHADYYMKARHYGDGEGRWRSVDPLWPRQLPYAYALQNPASLFDPSGLSAGIPLLAGPPSLQAECTKEWNNYVIRLCFGCNRDPRCHWECESRAQEYRNACVAAGRKPPRPQMPGIGYPPPAWVPRPGIGVVPIQREGPPAPNFGGTAGPPPTNTILPADPGKPCVESNDPDSCARALAFGRRPGSLIEAGKFLDECRACCLTFFEGYTLNPLNPGSGDRAQCGQACFDKATLMYYDPENFWNSFNNIGSPW